MNLWQCQEPGCKKTAVGVGGAVGLRAIGWYFSLGPVILCPFHRKDLKPVVCRDEGNDQPCHICAAEQSALEIQKTL